MTGHAIIIILGILSVLNLPIRSYAGETAVLDSLIKKAEENNPEIKSAYEEWQSKKYAVIPSRTPADLNFGIMSEQIPHDKSSLTDSEMQIFSLSQSYPFPGKLSLRGKSAKNTASGYYNLYRAKQLEVILKLKKAYYEYYYLSKVIDIHKEHSELLKHFSAVAEQRYAVGKSRQIDVLKAQVELAKILNMLVTLEQQKETAAAEINTILNNNPDEPLGTPEIDEKIKELDLTTHDLETLALENSPYLLAKSDIIEQSKNSYTLSKMNYLPDFTFSYRQRIMNNAFDSWDAGVNLNLPIYFWKQSNIAKKGRAELEKAEKDYTALKNLTFYEIKQLYTEIDTTYRLINLYKTDFLPKSEQAVKVAEIGYKGGKVIFLELIDSQNNLLQFRLDYQRYLVDYLKKMAELEKVTGKDF
jgi:outer membrane protein TolC